GPHSSLLEAPAAGQRPAVLRRPADHGQSVWWPSLHHGTAPGIAPRPEDAWAFLLVHDLRGQPRAGALGLLPEQGCGAGLPVHAAGAAPGSPGCPLGGLWSRLAAPLPSAADAPRHS